MAGSILLHPSITLTFPPTPPPPNSIIIIIIIPRECGMWPRAHGKAVAL